MNSVLPSSQYRCASKPPFQVIPGRMTSVQFPLRFVFWTIGVLLAAGQAWVFRYRVSADSVSYLDMSDGIMPGFDWHRLITGTWSPLYPVLLGLFRRAFHISPTTEIAAGHLLNIPIFVFAFLCFEYCLRSLLLRCAQFDPKAPWMRSAFCTVAYSLFLWGALSAISLKYLRADMLMSGFLYLAAGLTIRMQGESARWRDYLFLGAVLGAGYLAKAPLLHIGLLLLVLSLMVVRNRRTALPMTAGSILVLLLIGSFYFVPLSLSTHRFTLGESGSYNYLVHVNLDTPSWYLEDPALAAGTHPPEKVFDSPPTYVFPRGAQLVTNPVHFDPSALISNLRPRFSFRRQVQVAWQNLLEFGKTVLPLIPVFLVLVVLAVARGIRHLQFSQRGVIAAVVGFLGCAMYVAVHVEPRYVGAFAVLFCCGILFCLSAAPNGIHRTVGSFVAAAIGISLLFPIVLQTYQRDQQIGHLGDENSQAAGELGKLGIVAGSQVADITPVPQLMGLERIARVEIVAAVDFQRVNEFWNAPLRIQDEILKLLAARGVQAVIATHPNLRDDNLVQWKRLGNTDYWVWIP